MIVRDIYALDPLLAPKAAKLVELCAAEGVTLLITETLREEMTAIIYALQGRFTAEDLKMNPDLPNQLNRLRKKYKLYELSSAEFKRRITWTLESKHMAGLAFDCVPLKDGKAWWNAPKDVWEKIGTLGESLGLTWGGKWPSPDVPHFEITKPVKET